MGFKMSIDLLTSSAGDYARYQRRELSNYIMRGFSATAHSRESAELTLESAAVRAGCEVVVDLRYCVDAGRAETLFDRRTEARYTVAGTGLILKRG